MWPRPPGFWPCVSWATAGVTSSHVTSSTPGVIRRVIMVCLLWCGGLRRVPCDEMSHADHAGGGRAAGPGHDDAAGERRHHRILGGSGRHAAAPAPRVAGPVGRSPPSTYGRHRTPPRISSQATKRWPLPSTRHLRMRRLRRPQRRRRAGVAPKARPSRAWTHRRARPRARRPESPWPDACTRSLPSTASAGPSSGQPLMAQPSSLSRAGVRRPGRCRQDRKRHVAHVAGIDVPPRGEDVPARVGASAVLQQ